MTAALLISSLGCGSDSSAPVTAASAGSAGSGGQTTTGTAGSGGSGGGAVGATGGMSGGSMISSPDAGLEVGVPIASDSGTPADDASTMAFPKRVLLYHFSTLAIASLPAQLTFFKNKLTEWQYENEDSVDPAKFTDDNLARYAAVAMINTCFEPFGVGKPDMPQSAALQRFLQKGGGLFGTHCATVTFQAAAPPVLYNQLIGGRGGAGGGTAFFSGISTCTKVDDPLTALLPATFPYTGDLDNADFVKADSKVLVKCKWSGGGAREVSTSWYRMEGLGRVFYSNFAKEDADLKDATVGDKHIVPGLAWVLHR